MFEGNTVMPRTAEPYFVYYPIAILMASYAVWTVFRRTDWRRLDWCVAGLGIAFFVAKTLWAPPNGSDLSIFHAAGAAALHGANPYEIQGMMNPPVAVPLFEMLALFDFRTALVVWTVFGTVVGILLVPLASRAVGELPPHILAVLAAAVGLSIPMHFSMVLGQLSIWTALCITLTMVFAAQKRPVAAGIAAALAFIKPQSGLPTMVRFARLGQWWRALATMAAGLFALLLASGQTTHLFARIQLMQQNILVERGIGKLNDFSGQGPHAHTVLGFERLLWCLGIDDLSLDRSLGLAIAVMLGVALALEIARGHVDSRAAAALAAFYSLLFVYHRTHDAVVLALPLVYLAVELRRDRSSGRLAVAFCSVVAVLYIHPKTLGYVASRFPTFVARALFLPLPTTLLLIAVTLTLLHARQRRSQVAVPAGAGRVSGPSPGADSDSDSEREGGDSGGRATRQS
jgi:hypothetical protein